ncbi:MAG: NAD-binding protein [Vulcanisaeta sp.]|nr:NAD-binding protein [Vulcanisaeta sp.]MCG2892344.1 NAD-binding protein [Vulcanisaeta sp.]MCG2894831.1 NAD-binding protein [Vulcanisaeta sp.]
MRRAIVVGVNEIGIFVARLLVSNGYDVVMISRNEDEARVGKGVPAYVYIGDPTSEALLVKVGIDEAELLVSLCDDETNLRVAKLAKSHGVPTIVVLNHDKGRYLDKFIELGVMVIPVVDAVLSKIANYLKFQFKQLLFSDENVQAYYVVISSESPYVGRSVNEVARKCNVAIPLLIRDGEVVLVKDDLRIEANDKLLIVGEKDSVVDCVEKIY